MHTAWILVLLVGSACALKGAVRRDPVTGKWVEVTEDQMRSDPRDSRASGGDGDDFFGGFGFVDNRPSQPEPQIKSHIASQDIVSPHVVTQSRASHTSKYSREFPMDTIANIQQSAKALIPTMDLVQTQKGMGVETIIHYPSEQVNNIQLQSTVLTAKPIGTLCRYQGYAPLTDCPKEATNGCVDRIPCERKCAVDAYFHYRCRGPQEVSTANMVPSAIDSPPPSMDTEQYVKDLSQKIQTALQNNDYTSLARLIVTAQKSPSSALLASNALVHLAQAQHEQAEKSDDASSM